MASTYTLISSQVLASSAASVTFSSIPSTYKDLVLKWSIRSSTSSTNDAINLTLNGNSTAIYSSTYLYGNGATTASLNSSTSSGNLFFQYSRMADGATATANTFSNAELYIPSYTASQNKPASFFGAQEDNSTTANIFLLANLAQITATISSIGMVLNSSANFVSGSSFYLYGI